ncbi:proline dehydrogenase family protein, partial [Candidatus Micrarchaeota archaeon]|nr:proline dehydrogenase family protein [Candidatus Micrarchaeota archaeon]
MRPTSQVGKTEERPTFATAKLPPEGIRGRPEERQEPSSRTETNVTVRSVDGRHPLFRMIQPDRPNITTVTEIVRVPENDGHKPRGVGTVRGMINRLVLPFMIKWIAGESLEEAVVVAKGLNEEGSGVMINCLGEHYKKRKQVEATMGEYVRMLDPEFCSKADYVISFKLSQFGLDIDWWYCYENARVMAEKAKKEGKLVWIDMESSSYTDSTLEMYRMLLEAGCDNLGLCLQANLKRTAGDLESLLALNEEGKFVKIRLCKGAYKEPPEVAYQTKQEIDGNFRRLILRLAESSEENVLGIATHDPEFMELAKDISKKRKNVEVQMLKGIEENARRELINQGVMVITYLPYGEDAVPYCIRRVR